MSAVRIGSHILSSPLILAPMAGISDRPFRSLCRRFGAALAVSEMVTSDTRLWNTRKSRARLCHAEDPSPRSVQIAGSDPSQMAEAARQNVALGAEIIDINMGCPAKKVCNKAAGSALMRDEPLVAEILKQVVAAVDVPVTLKIRTGWDHQQRNAVNIAKIAEQSGIAALAVHGRTRADFYQGSAEYETIAEVKQVVSIPVFANGDVDSPEKAQQVLRQTGVDALLIGRAAQGRPWIFREIEYFLRTGCYFPAPSIDEFKQVLFEHLAGLYETYGQEHGVRIARKHVAWYLADWPKPQGFLAVFNQQTAPEAQHQQLSGFLSTFDYLPGTETGEEQARWQ